MEPNSAACAMKWSIELEKALRSKKPGRSVEAILQMGPKLVQWSEELEATMAVCNMYGLVPGEDRLFANTILLRLADGFASGDKHIRLAVVRVFLLELKHRRNKVRSKRIKGIVSKSRVHNQAELLMRVKVVFDTGDIESRSLALVLFGCWADFAKDSAQIRYLILSSLVSSHVLEVKAALFAAGCFCELSGDFASVVLEMLSNLVTSSETLMPVKLAGARVFAKMGCTHPVAFRAHKTGLGLLSNSSEEEFLITLMVSLSKLASKFTLLIPEQVDLLLSFLSKVKTLRMQATALRCLHFFFMKGGYHSSVSAHATKALCSILGEPQVPSAMHCEALQILHKALLYSVPKLPSVDVLEFRQLLTVVENASHSPVTSKTLLAIHILADVSVKLTTRKEMGSNGDFSSSLAPSLNSLIIDHITLLVKPLPDFDLDSKVFQAVQRLLNALLLLVGEHPDLGIMVLDKVGLFIQFMANIHGTSMSIGQAVHDIVELKGEKNSTSRSKILCVVNKFLFGCLESINESGSITTEVYDKVKLLVECVCRCSLFDCYTKTIYSLLLHSPIIWKCIVDKDLCFNARESDIPLRNYSVEHLIFTLECADNMLKKRDNWHAYRTGTYSACQGAWVTATCIFGQLTENVQSDFCYSWLNSLVQFSHSESIIQVFLLPEKGSILLPQLEMQKFSSKHNFSEIGRTSAGDIKECALSKALVKVHCGLCAAGKTLETTSIIRQKFCFQRWFLALRAKYIETVLDMVKLLDSIAFNQNNVSNDEQVRRSIMVECPKSLWQITQISVSLKKLAQEFDMIATSFLGMDGRSAKLISALALTCSVLALCSGFTCFIPGLTCYETPNACITESQNNFLGAMLVQDLVGRLWHMDQDTSKNLCLLLEKSREQCQCFNLQARNQILAVGCEARDILSICNYAVSTVLSLQNEAEGTLNEEMLSKITKDGLQFLLDIITKCIHVPFRTPKCFFKLRPCIGSEIFASNASDEIFVLPGFCLSLNLCLQMKNVPLDLPVQLRKFYCILWCRVSFKVPGSSGENKEQLQGHYPAWESDDLVEMNAKLFHYVTGCAQKKNNGKRGRGDEFDNNDSDVIAFVQFEPDHRRRGFADCLLDVSSFPEGSYGIKWLSCCVDSQGSYWSLLPLNAGPIFAVRKI